MLVSEAMQHLMRLSNKDLFEEDFKRQKEFLNEDERKKFFDIFQEISQQYLEKIKQIDENQNLLLNK